MFNVSIYEYKRLLCWNKIHSLKYSLYNDLTDQTNLYPRSVWCSYIMRMLMMTTILVMMMMMTVV